MSGGGRSLASPSGLDALATLEGFSGAAIITAAGELLATRGGDEQLEAVAALANAVLLRAKEASEGSGRGPQVHIACDRAHVLVRCLNEGTDPLRAEPGKAHLHLVVVLTAEASLGVAGERMAASLRLLADAFRA